MVGNFNVKVVEGHMKADGEYYVLFFIKSKGSLFSKKTEAIKSTNPVWNQSFEIQTDNIQNDFIIIQVYDRQIIGDILLAEKEIWTSDFISTPNKTVSIDLFRKKKRAGTVNIEISSNFDKENNDQIQDNNMKEKEEIPILYIKILEASKLRKTGKNTIGYPSVTLKLKSQDIEQTQETETIEGTRDPVWNEEFEIPCEFPDSDVLMLNIQDNSESGGTLCDEVTIPISSFSIGGPRELITERLIWRRKPAGTLKYEIQLALPSSSS